MPNPETARAPDVSQFLRDLRELRELASANNFDLFVFLRELGDDAAPLLAADINNTAAVSALNFVPVYQLSKGLKALLAALRMVNGDADEIVSGAREVAHAENS